MQKYLNSSRDKESNGTQFLQIGVTTTKLLLYKDTTSFFYEMPFCTKFYNGFLLKISTCVIMPGFANQVTFSFPPFKQAQKPADI